MKCGECDQEVSDCDECGTNFEVNQEIICTDHNHICDTDCEMGSWVYAQTYEDEK